MKMRKVIAAFLALICMFTTVSFCGQAASAATTDTVYAQTSSSLRQGDYGYCYVYLDDLTDLAALTVTVYYDADKLTLLDSYNQVDCLIYDSSSQPGSLQYTYIFSGDGQNQKTGLFYFQYQIKADAPIGESYFDIVISEAYNTALESLPIGGSRCNFFITESQTKKQCTIYGSSSVSTSVMEEFTLAYSVSDYRIASGALSLHYDPELFEFVELTPGGMLEGKVVDVNTTLPGTVYISFVGTTYSYDTSLLQIRFRTICNEDTTAQITLAAADLCDLDLESIQCSGYTTTVQVSHDPAYTVDAPSMRLSAAYHEETGKVTVVVELDADSHLGAGDFVLKFDPACLSYSSATKMFDPTFFNINDKKVGEGELRFSIISLTDITQAQTVLVVEFDAVRGFREQTTKLEIAGSGLADAMTAPITLNFVHIDVTIPLGYLYGDADGNQVVSLRDILLLRQHLANRDPYTGVSSVYLEMGADANGDEKITLQDVLLLRKYLANRDPHTGESDIILGP